MANGLANSRDDRPSTAPLFGSGNFYRCCADAQLTITNGNHTLEISGSVSTFYNYRSVNAGEVDLSKNRFKLRDAQIGIDGSDGLLAEARALITKIATALRDAPIREHFTASPIVHGLGR